MGSMLISFGILVLSIILIAISYNNYWSAALVGSVISTVLSSIFVLCHCWFFVYYHFPNAEHRIIIEETNNRAALIAELNNINSIDDLTVFEKIADFNTRIETHRIYCRDPWRWVNYSSAYNDIEPIDISDYICAPIEYNITCNE